MMSVLKLGKNTHEQWKQTINNENTEKNPGDIIKSGGKIFLSYPCIWKYYNQCKAFKIMERFFSRLQSIFSVLPFMFDKSSNTTLFAYKYDFVFLK